VQEETVTEMINLLNQSRPSEHEQVAKEHSIGHLEDDDQSLGEVHIKIVYSEPQMRLFRINRDLSSLECNA